MLSYSCKLNLLHAYDVHLSGRRGYPPKSLAGVRNSNSKIFIIFFIFFQPMFSQDVHFVFLICFRLVLDRYSISWYNYITIAYMLFILLYFIVYIYYMFSYIFLHIAYIFTDVICNVSFKCVSWHILQSSSSFHIWYSVINHLKKYQLKFGGLNNNM